MLDETTSALDANSESVVSKNFERLTASVTKLIVAHRLSTVRNAHQIVVLDQGRFAEVGTHAALTQRRGLYFNLVNNQLELGCDTARAVRRSAIAGYRRWLLGPCGGGYARCAGPAGGRVTQPLPEHGMI